MHSKGRRSDIYFEFLPVDTDGLISQSLLTGNFEAAVDVCLHADRMVCRG